MGRVRKYRETSGRMLVIEVPEDTWNEIEKAMDMQDGIVGAETVMSELKICKKTLANLHACGKITRCMYTVAVNGVKKYFIKKILGLEK